MESYTHLTQVERYQIHSLMEADQSLTEIAHVLGRDKSTISRELARNRGRCGYRPKQAHRLATARACAARTRRRISERQWQGIAELIRWDWSPQQIAERAAREGTLAISPEWIYQYVYADKAAGGTLVTHLRGQKPYRKRYGSGRERRGRIAERVGIEHRAPSAEQRRRIGHWEADTMHGRRRRGGAVTAVERRTRYTRLGKLAQINARATRERTRRRLAPIAASVQTLTGDNGREFADHQGIAADLGARFYFADPYASWQRGTNENTNGLIRQYLPKSRDLTTLTGAEIRKIENRLNHRPRKCLGYRTPHEVFYNTQMKLTVALRG